MVDKTIYTRITESEDPSTVGANPSFGGRNWPDEGSKTWMNNIAVLRRRIDAA